jgi:hypothetical protein
MDFYCYFGPEYSRIRLLRWLLMCVQTVGKTRTWGGSDVGGEGQEQPEPGGAVQAAAVVRAHVPACPRRPHPNTRRDHHQMTGPAHSLTLLITGTLLLPSPLHLPAPTRPEGNQNPTVHVYHLGYAHVDRSRLPGPAPTPTISDKATPDQKPDRSMHCLISKKGQKLRGVFDHRGYK